MARDTNDSDDAGRAARDLSYADYLRLDALLGAQAPRSAAHDEMLFIIQHQTTELWMRLAIHELDAARAAIARGDLRPAFKMLTRIARIFEQLNAAWDVLRTLTPVEYSRFRHVLGTSSGFQSHQYREIEFIVGNRSRAMLRQFDHDPPVVARLESELRRPSLYDEALRLLSRSGIEVPEPVLGRDLAAPYRESDAVTDAWRTVYSDPGAHWPLYELAEKLVDFEDYFRRWRFNHVTTVERIIGSKAGTGGTEGVAYLRRVLAVELFPELWRVRTAL